MSTDSDSRLLTADALAADLLAGLERSRAAVAAGPADLAVALAVTLRATHLLGTQRVARAAPQLPANIRALLEAPTAAVEPAHASIEEQDYLGLVDLLDLISDERLSCIAPRLHRGWQDKNQSCRDARAAVREQLDDSIGAGTREALRRALALNRRTFGVPGPVALDPSALRSSLNLVLELIEQLAPGSRTDELAAATKALRAQLS